MDKMIFYIYASTTGLLIQGQDKKSFVNHALLTILTLKIDQNFHW